MKASLRTAAVLLMLGGFGGAWITLAQEPAGQPESTEATPPATDDAGSEADAAETGGRPSDREFVPTEKIPADASIAFPVDI